MEAKFKAGDEVRIITSRFPSNIGAIGLITDCCSDNWYNVVWAQPVLCLDEEFLECSATTSMHTSVHAIQIDLVDRTEKQVAPREFVKVIETLEETKSAKSLLKSGVSNQTNSELCLDSHYVDVSLNLGRAKAFLFYAVIALGLSVFGFAVTQLADAANDIHDKVAHVRR